ncbi:MAG: sulfurtransferase-like selenium metabolism protein YedF [Clostridia bacterium]|nr:sulfurtransferase-like selenium metabolism protein YedF [Clostridia bacterium]
MIIDATGKVCPMPVIMAKKEIDNGASQITVIVDNKVAVENLTRLAVDKGYSTSITELDNLFHVNFLKNSHVEKVTKCDCAEFSTKCDNYSVFIGKDYVGDGDKTLGSNLMAMAIYTLSQEKDIPETIIFMNSGVKLPAGDNEQVIQSLSQLAAKGCQILVCGTCLNYYSLQENLKIGKVSNMYEILQKMKDSSKVITL